MDHLRQAADGQDVDTAAGSGLVSSWCCCPPSIDTIAQQVPPCMPADLSRALQRDVSVRRARLHASATLLGWLDEATQWQILHHNAQRAADCFHGWQDCGAAFARGHHASATATIPGTGYPGRCRP